MNCETAKSLIQPYLEGRLAVLERNEFVYHVTECGACEAEVIEYREVFLALKKMPRMEAPGRLSVAVMAHLHAEGLVHEPMFPTMRRALDRFLDLPVKVRYPAAALAAVVAVYAPVALVLAGARGSLAGVAEAVARAIVWLQGELGGAPALSSFSPYTRAARTIAHATAALVSPSAFMLAAAVVAVVVFSMSRVLRRKRHSGHALFI